MLLKSLLLLVECDTQGSAFTGGVCYTRVCFYWWGLLLLSLFLLLGSVIQGSAFTGGVYYS